MLIAVRVLEKARQSAMQYLKTDGNNNALGEDLDDVKDLMSELKPVSSAASVLVLNKPGASASPGGPKKFKTIINKNTNLNIINLNSSHGHGTTTVVTSSKNHL